MCKYKDVSIRTVTLDGEVWFCLRDVALALGYVKGSLKPSNIRTGKRIFYNCTFISSDGLHDYARRASHAPAYSLKIKEWKEFIDFLDDYMSSYSGSENISSIVDIRDDNNSVDSALTNLQKLLGELLTGLQDFSQIVRAIQQEKQEKDKALQRIKKYANDLVKLTA